MLGTFRTKKDINFNSHARVGRDLSVADFLDYWLISTHTPAWGVTISTTYVIGIIDYFNSHARVGRDVYVP